MVYVVRFLIASTIAIVVSWFLLDLFSSFGELHGLVCFSLGYFVARIVNDKLLPWMGV